LTLVVDASVAVAACAQKDGFAELGDELIAPPLMWSEASANLHLELFKGAIEREDAEIMHERLERCPVKRDDRQASAGVPGSWPSVSGGDEPTTRSTSRSPRSATVV
jgi:hypothetical protein